MRSVSKKFIILVVLSSFSCKGSAVVFDQTAENPRLVAPKTEKKIIPMGVALKTHGQLRETFENLTDVIPPATAYSELAAHMPQTNSVSGLTGATQAAIFRFASAHCATLVSEKYKAQAARLFGIEPDDKEFDEKKSEALVQRAVALWPQAKPSDIEEMNLMLKDVLTRRSPADKPVSLRSAMLATCTAALASAHTTMH